MQDRIRESGHPLAAPSAKSIGSISPTRAEHVLAGLGVKSSMILDAGPTERGLESTIVAPDEDHIRLLRPGPITAEMLHSLTSLPVTGAQGGKIEAPGQLLSHYAPSKPLRLNAASARGDSFLLGIGSMDCDLNLSERGSLQQAAASRFDALTRAFPHPTRTR